MRSDYFKSRQADPGYRFAVAVHSRGRMVGPVGFEPTTSAESFVYGYLHALLNFVIPPTGGLLTRCSIFWSPRSEERRVGKECRSRWSPYQSKKKKTRRPLRSPWQARSGRRVSWRRTHASEAQRHHATLHT